jgi:hypothetical protein
MQPVSGLVEARLAPRGYLQFTERLGEFSNITTQVKCFENLGATL